MKLLRFLKKFLRLSLILAIAFSIWAATDLFIPHPVDLKKFDPNEVARLDTAMWRSYYAKERLKLFSQATELLRTQYRMPFLRSNLVGYYAARAAFVFKDGKSRADYEKALPYLVSFYSAIKRDTNIKFDAERAAKSELEWWIIHRERKKYQEGDLARALAETAAEIYQMPAEKFIEHGWLRAEAMKIRDTQAEAGGVSEEDWQKIADLLHASWQSLFQAVQE